MSPTPWQRDRVDKSDLSTFGFVGVQSWKQPKNGFTLVELLVVVGIIAILSALSFAVTHSAVQAARNAQCLSNLRSTLSATSTAAGDNNGKYPVMRGYSWEPPYDGTGQWIADALSPYLGYSADNNPAAVLRCPLGVQNPAEAWLAAPAYCSYRYNVYFAQNHFPQTGRQAMLFFDATWNDWTAVQVAHSPGATSYINVAYTDGSVSRMSYNDFKTADQGDDSTSDFFKDGWTQ